MSREDAQMKIRLPAKLRDRVVAASAAAKRSLNAEIVDRLELSFIHQVEGREADEASLRNEVMELRHGLMMLTMALVNDDKQQFKEVVEGTLAKYRAEVERIERDGKAARDRHRQYLIERDGEPDGEPPF